MQMFSRVMCRIVLFFFGYLWISVDGEVGKDNKKAPIVVSNHVSFMDGIILMACVFFVGDFYLICVC